MITYRKADIKDIETLIGLRIDFMKEVMDIKDDKKDMELRKSLFEYFSLHATDIGRPIYKTFGFSESGDEMILKMN